MGILNFASMVLTAALPRSIPARRAKRRDPRGPAARGAEYQKPPSLAEARREAWLLSWTIRPL